MSKKTSESPKDVPAVNLPSLSDGFYEVEAILRKRVRKVKFLLFSLMGFFSALFWSMIVIFLPNFLFCLTMCFFLLVPILQGKVEYFVKWWVPLFWFLFNNIVIKLKGKEPNVIFFMTVCLFVYLWLKVRMGWVSKQLGASRELNLCSWCCWSFWREVFIPLFFCTIFFTFFFTFYKLRMKDILTLCFCICVVFGMSLNELCISIGQILWLSETGWTNRLDFKTCFLTNICIVLKLEISKATEGQTQTWW